MFQQRKMSTHWTSSCHIWWYPVFWESFWELAALTRRRLEDFRLLGYMQYLHWTLTKRDFTPNPTIRHLQTPSVKLLRLLLLMFARSNQPWIALNFNWCSFNSWIHTPASCVFFFRWLKYIKQINQFEQLSLGLDRNLFPGSQVWWFAGLFTSTVKKLSQAAGPQAKDTGAFQRDPVGYTPEN